MRFEFKLPDIGEGVVEGEVVKWLVNDGDTVQAEQPVVEIMTDKATVVIPSPKAGKVLQRSGKEGEMIKVHSTLLVLETDGVAGEKGAPAPAQAPAAKAPPPAAAKPSAPSPVKAVPPIAPPKPVAVPPAAAAPPALRAVPPPAEGDARVRATPVTRKLAADAGIDLTTVAGSGPAGRVLKSDVLPLVENGGRAGGNLARLPSGGEERVPLRGLRKRIAEKMQRSRRTAAHFTFVEEVDCTRLVEMRKRLNASLAQSAVAGEAPLKISFLPFIIKATVAALKKFPYLNASVDDETNEIVVKHFYNVGVAAATPDGLIVPVIHNADQRNLRDLALEITRLAGDARTGKSQLPDLQGGTFTITSMGEMGGLFATPVINHPEVAILGVHRMRPTPVVRDGQVVVRDVMWLSCSFDHRIIDGAVGAQFTYEIIKRLEDPELLLLELA